MFPVPVYIWSDTRGTPFAFVAASVMQPFELRMNFLKKFLECVLSRKKKGLENQFQNIFFSTDKMIIREGLT